MAQHERERPLAIGTPVRWTDYGVPKHGIVVADSGRSQVVFVQDAVTGRQRWTFRENLTVSSS